MFQVADQLVLPLLSKRNFFEINKKSSFRLSLTPLVFGSRLCSRTLRSSEGKFMSFSHCWPEISLSFSPLTALIEKLTSGFKKSKLAFVGRAHPAVVESKLSIYE